MTALERAARALHKRYVEERIRNGVKPSDLPSWDDLDVDGVYYFTAPVRDVIAAIRDHFEKQADALQGAAEAAESEEATIAVGQTHEIISALDALLAEGR